MLSKEVLDFVEVSKFKNLSKAADYLGVRQSGLSKSLKRLEEQVGANLFLRTSKGLEHTEAGLIYYDAIKLILSYEEKTAQDIAGLNSEIKGVYSIGIHPIIAHFFSPKLKMEIKKYPGLSTQYHFLNSREITEQIIQGHIDIGIVVEPMPYPDLVIKKLWKEYIGLYSCDGKEKDDLLYNSAMIHSQKILREYPHANHERIDDYNVLYSMVKRTESMGVLPHPIAEKENRLKLIKKFKPDMQVCLIFRSDRFQSKGFKKLVELIPTAASL